MIHKFVEISAHPISNTLDRDKTEKKHRSQVTVADLIFIRNPADMTRSDTEKLKHLALLSFAVFRSYDLTLRCLSDLYGAGALDSLHLARKTLGERRNGAGTTPPQLR